MNPEDLSGPKTAEGTSDFAGGDVTDASTDLEAMDSLGEDAEDEISPTFTEYDDWNLTNYGDAGPSASDLFGNDNVSPTFPEDDWKGFEDPWEYSGDARIPEGTYGWDIEPSDTEAVSMPADKIADPGPNEPDNTGVVRPSPRTPVTSAIRKPSGTGTRAPRIPGPTPKRPARGATPTTRGPTRMPKTPSRTCRTRCRTETRKT
jgi:hypothetical protein